MSIELRPEEKQRIEEEERRRVAEDQYRAGVRTDLEESNIPVRRKGWHYIVLGLSCLMAAVALALLFWDLKMEAARIEAPRIASVPQIH